MYIRVTKEFNFEMAHALSGYDGPCKNIHGHSYQLAVTVKGNPCTEEGNPKLGMVIDFSIIKKIVAGKIIDAFDHALVLNKSDEAMHSCIKNQKLVLVNYQPTCENLIIDFAKQIQHELPENIQLHHLQLRETATSYAEWYAEDN